MQIKYTLKVAEKVAEKVAAVDAKVAEVDANVAAVGEMVAEIGVARQKGGRSHPEKKVEAVRTAWTVYLGRTTARMGVNTRPTNRGAFDYSRHQLELAGVTHTQGVFRNQACSACPRIPPAAQNNRCILRAYLRVLRAHLRAGNADKDVEEGVEIRFRAKY